VNEARGAKDSNDQTSLSLTTSAVEEDDFFFASLSESEE
ncbi:hypothetical protein Tco_0914091, partial [Tanacetum coccineum]